jgi:hypothetical protein
MGRRIKDLSRTILPLQKGESIGLSSSVLNLNPQVGTVSHLAVVESPIWDSHTPLLDPDTIQSPEEQKDKGWIVTVYDSPHNTYLEVMTILMLATKCDAEEAEIETWEIDNLGQSVVHRDSNQACQAAAKVIATIGIRAIATPDPLA